jgi:hypothetical protein
LKLLGTWCASKTFFLKGNFIKQKRMGNTGLSRPWNSASLLSNRHRGLFPQGRGERGLKKSSIEVQNARTYTSTPPYVFIAWCLSSRNALGELRRLVAGVPGSSPGQVMWDLRWIKWHWSRFSPSTSVSPANHSSDCCTLIFIHHPRRVQ